jgi:hypothetical protein
MGVSELGKKIAVCVLDSSWMRSAAFGTRAARFGKHDLPSQLKQKSQLFDEDFKSSFRSALI